MLESLLITLRPLTMRILSSLLLLIPLSAMAQQWAVVEKMKDGELIEVENASFGYSRDTAYNGAPSYAGATFRVTTADQDQIVFSFILERMDCTVGFGKLQVQVRSGTSWAQQGPEFWRAERSDIYDRAAKKICAMDEQYQRRLAPTKK